MFAQKAEPQPTVHVPAPSKDRPSWIKVGAFATIGFLVGVAWPRIFNVKIGAAPPENVAAAIAHREEAAAQSAAVPPPAPSATAPAAVVSAAPAAMMNAAPKVTLGKGFILSCKKTDGETIQRSGCGRFEAFEGVAGPRLRRLEQCPAADGVSGTLSVVIDVDFAGNHVGVEPGDQTSIPSPDGLYACVKAAFQGVPFTGIDHEHVRYRVRYNAKLAAPAAPAASASGSAKPGEDIPAEIVVREAKVRDAPSSSGQILGTLPRGTKLLAHADKGGWWKAHYGPDMASEGFVFHSLIGK